MGRKVTIRKNSVQNSNPPSVGTPIGNSMAAFQREVTQPVTGASSLSKHKEGIALCAHTSIEETPIGNSIEAYLREVNQQIADMPSPDKSIERNDSSVLNPIEQSILRARHSFNKPRETISSGVPNVGEIAEGPLSPDTKKTSLSLEVKSLVERHGFDAVAKETAKYAPWRAIILLSNPEQSEATIDDSTLAHLYRRYLALLESVKLPEDGLKTHEQAKAASLLSTTYQNLCKEQSKFGIEPPPKDLRVYTAERLKTEFYRNRGRDGHPSLPAARRPRGRPKKRPSPE